MPFFFCILRYFFNLFFSQVFGCDSRGRVCDLGIGVSKTIIKHLAPYKRALEGEHEYNTHLLKLRSKS